jgi:hypothetical protein
MKDGRRGLPYAPYLMFMIERVIGLRFPKDGMHTVYKIEKTHPAIAIQGTGSTYAHEDIPESSHSRSQRSRKWKKKIESWMKAIFGKCSYAIEHAYETQFEQRQQRGEHLPPLSPIPPPPQFDLLSFSDTKFDGDVGDDSESEERPRAPSADWQETLSGYQWRTKPRRSTYSTRFTATTHHQGRARIDSDDDDDGGTGTAAGTSTAAGISRASGYDDIDWDDIQEE